MLLLKYLYFLEISPESNYPSYYLHFHIQDNNKDKAILFWWLKLIANRLKKEDFACGSK